MIGYVLKLIETGTIIGYSSSFIAIALSIYVYYDGKKSRKQNIKLAEELRGQIQADIEKIKGEQGKKLESFKIFTKQRNEHIIKFYNSMCELLGGCSDLAWTGIITLEPDYSKISLKAFSFYLDKQKIVDHADRELLTAEYDAVQEGKKRQSDLSFLLHQANYNKYRLFYYKSNTDFIRLKLYITADEDKVITEFYNKVSKFYRENLNPAFKNKEIKIDKESEKPALLQYTDYVETLNDEFSTVIVPLLRKMIQL